MEVAQKQDYQLSDEALDVSAVAVRKPEQLGELSGLIIPGGESTAIGKLMLGQMPEAMVDAQLSGGNLARYTAGTITDAKRLRAELARIRRQGYSIDNQEFMSGVVCLAVPVAGPRDGQVCAGLAISAAQARLTLAGVKRFLPDLRAAAARRSRELAGEGIPGASAK